MDLGDEHHQRWTSFTSTIFRIGYVSIACGKSYDQQTSTPRKNLNDPIDKWWDVQRCLTMFSCWNAGCNFQMSSPIAAATSSNAFTAFT